MRGNPHIYSDRRNPLNRLLFCVEAGRGKDCPEVKPIKFDEAVEYLKRIDEAKQKNDYEKLRQLLDEIRGRGASYRDLQYFVRLEKRRRYFGGLVGEIEYLGILEEK